MEVVDLLEDDAVHDVLERPRPGAHRVGVASSRWPAGRSVRSPRRGVTTRWSTPALRGLDRYLDEHRVELQGRFRDQSPWWLPGAVEDRIFERLLDGLRAVLDDMANDRGHGLRRQLDARILRFVEELQTLPTLRARGEQLTRDLLERPRSAAWVAAVWADAKAHLRAQAADPGSELHGQLTRRHRVDRAPPAVGTGAHRQGRRHRSNTN